MKLSDLFQAYGRFPTAFAVKTVHHHAGFAGIGFEGKSIFMTR